MSLKKSVVSPPKNLLTFDKLKQNMLVKGKVTKIETFGTSSRILVADCLSRPSGVFVKLKHSELVGLRHLSNVSSSLDLPESSAALEYRFRLRL